MTMIRLKIEEKVETEYLVDIEVDDDLTEEELEEKANELEKGKNIIETFGGKIKRQQGLSFTHKLIVTEVEKLDYKYEKAKERNEFLANKKGIN